MFKKQKTYCKMPNELQAKQHAEMVSKHKDVKGAGTQHTEQHGWRSWFISEMFINDAENSEEI